MRSDHDVYAGDEPDWDRSARFERDAERTALPRVYRTPYHQPPLVRCTFCRGEKTPTVRDAAGTLIVDDRHLDCGPSIDDEPAPARQMALNL